MCLLTHGLLIKFRTRKPRLLLKIGAFKGLSRYQLSQRFHGSERSAPLAMVNLLKIEEGQKVGISGLGSRLNAH